MGTCQHPTQGPVRESKSALRAVAALGLSLSALLGAGAGAQAQTLPRDSAPPQTISSQFSDPSPAPLDGFGYSVALSGNGQFAVVGSPGSTVGSTDDEGTAYVYELVDGAWTLVAQLAPTDPLPSDHFGESVAISSDGSVIAVGAPGSGLNTDVNNDSPGGAYVFTEPAQGWSGDVEQTTELAGSDTVQPGGESNDGYGSLFGSSVSLSSDASVIVVGAAFQPCTQSLLCGAAYLFAEPSGGWSSESVATQTVELGPSDPPTFAFGAATSISADGSTVAIASSNGGFYTYVEPAGGWASDSGTVTESDYVAVSGSAPLVNDSHGQNTLALSGDGSVIALGLVSSTSSPLCAGSVEIFSETGGTWQPVAQLEAPDAGIDGGFGLSVSLSNDGTSLLVGAPGSFVSSGINLSGCTDDYSGAGTAYLFSDAGSTTWSLVNEYAPDDGFEGLGFGYSTDLLDSGSTIFVGAPDILGNWYGESPSVSPRALSAHSTPPLYGQGYLKALPNQPRINRVSSTRVSKGKSFTVTGTHLTHATAFIGDTRERVTHDSSSHLTVIVSRSTKSGKLVVATREGSTSYGRRISVR